MNLDEQIECMEGLRDWSSSFREWPDAVLASLRELKRLREAGSYEQFHAEVTREMNALLAERDQPRTRVAELKNASQWPRQANAEGGWTLDFEWLCVVRQRAEAFDGVEGISLEQVEAALLAAREVMEMSYEQ